ncbi:RagB/SusD family nutrient uptake outer membrane protein [uncultured Draconibacterium sp.]|uniref:RagB/SusD family nutrient uptake outer membrane protein n=1 Tax=uncultured Draconibacterium sp. TaxID=1573823 RepID=UPI0025F6ED32|nr:RagB/SusD family nutrient uptake outer membrane protein [uncultured Draconibacterium sp.]
MKTYKLFNKIVLAVGILFMMSLPACDLDEGSMGAVSATAFYNDIAALDAGITGIYGTWHRVAWGVDVLAAYTGADDLATRNESNKWVFLEGDQLNLSGGNLRTINIWNGYYQVIYECNNFLENANPDGASEEEIAPYHADARFIRGLLYFELANIFGDVPLVLATTPDYEIGLTPFKEVMEQAISDFKYVEQWANNTARDTPAGVAGQEINGRASKTAARAYLAKAYMLLSGWPTYENHWDKVESYTRQIIDMGAYSLLDDYAQNWGNKVPDDWKGTPFTNANARENVSWKGNKESIFAHHNKVDVWPVTTQSRSYGRFWRDWMDMFVENHFHAEFPEGYRKNYSFAWDQKWRYAGWTAWPYAEGQSYPDHPSMLKFQFGTINASDFKKWSGLAGSDPAPETFLGFEHVMNSSNDMPLMRYAEVLLMYAEACARQNKPGANPSAVEALNYVRRRAYGGGYEKMGDIQANLPVEFWKNPEPAVDYPQAGESDLIQAIIDERAWEFVAEFGGNRWLDLIRTESLAEALSSRDGSEASLIGDPNDQNRWRAPVPSTESQYNPNIK